MFLYVKQIKVFCGFSQRSSPLTFEYQTISIWLLEIVFYFALMIFFLIYLEFKKNLRNMGFEENI